MVAPSDDKTVDPATPVARLRGLSKTFGRRQVLRSVDLDVRPGEIHGLLGQNGSGKSTLIKILSGYHAPDDPDGGPGPELHVRGEPVTLPLTAPESAALGLSFVHQDLPTVGAMTVLENLRVGRFDTAGFWRIPWRRERAAAQSVLRDFGITASPDALVNAVGDTQRALLLVLRGLLAMPTDRPGVLVLDEPTAYLPRDGVDRVYRAIRATAERGHGVLLVTHRLDEVLAMTDRVSILRDGRLVESRDTSTLDEQELIRAILGFELEQLYPDRDAATGDVAMRVSDLRTDSVRDVSFSVRAGEIVGLTGLIGAGQEEVPYALFGARHVRDGQVSVGGRDLDAKDLTPRRAMRAGMALLPADRRVLSGVGAATVQENVSLPALDRYFKGMRLRPREERRGVGELLEKFSVVPANPAALLSTLSGGNQQKALVAKWFQLGPSVLMLHEPTQGVDVGSKQAIFRLLEDLAARGTAVILVSSEYEDLANLCDRVIVFRRGRPEVTLPASNLTEERILEQCLITAGGPEQQGLDQ